MVNKKEELVKVLYFVDRMLRGGIQSLVIDWVSRFDKNKIHVDFLLLDDGVKYELEDTLKKMGCNVYKLDGIWIKKPCDFIKQAKALDDFFKDHHDYKVVHLHSSSKNYLVLKYAEKYGIPMRISHSHNIDFQTKNQIKKIIGNILKPKLIKYSTNYFACSKIAGEWLFGESIVNSEKFEIIHNAIDYDKFKYNETTRKEMRKELNIADDEILIGHVGRFTNQKNHSFLIEIFKGLYEKNKKYKLIMIGSGELENSIKKKVEKLDLNKNVIFAGFQNDVNNYMQAMDLFVFPSLYEGLGLVLVEAQASGLPCFATKGTIPIDVKITDNFNFIPLNVQKWIYYIYINNLNREKSTENKIKENNYFIEDVCSQLEKHYLAKK